MRKSPRLPAAPQPLARPREPRRGSRGRHHTPETRPLGSRNDTVPRSPAAESSRPASRGRARPHDTCPSDLHPTWLVSATSPPANLGSTSLPHLRCRRSHSSLFWKNTIELWVVTKPQAKPSFSNRRTGHRTTNGSLCRSPGPISLLPGASGVCPSGPGLSPWRPVARIQCLLPKRPSDLRGGDGPWPTAGPCLITQTPFLARAQCCMTARFAPSWRCCEAPALMLP